MLQSLKGRRRASWLSWLVIAISAFLLVNFLPPLATLVYDVAGEAVVEAVSAAAATAVEALRDRGGDGSPAPDGLTHIHAGVGIPGMR